MKFESQNKQYLNIQESFIASQKEVFCEVV